MTAESRAATCGWLDRGQGELAKPCGHCVGGETAACRVPHQPSDLGVSEEHILLRAGGTYASKLRKTAQGARHVVAVRLDRDPGAP
jgi:hypothetical protein